MKSHFTLCHHNWYHRKSLKFKCWGHDNFCRNMRAEHFNIYFTLTSVSLCFWKISLCCVVHLLFHQCQNIVMIRNGVFPKNSQKLRTFILSMPFSDLTCYCLAAIYWGHCCCCYVHFRHEYFLPAFIVCLYQCCFLYSPGLHTLISFVQPKASGQQEKKCESKFVNFVLNSNFVLKNQRFCG